MSFNTQIKILKRAFRDTVQDMFTFLKYSLLTAGVMFYVLSAIKAVTGTSEEILFPIGIIISLAIGVLSPFVLLPKLRKKLHKQ